MPPQVRGRSANSVTALLNRFKRSSKKSAQEEAAKARALKRRPKKLSHFLRRNAKK